MVLSVLRILSCSALDAFEPRAPLRQYLHTAWRPEDGYPLPAISALAQTNDGYLWLGSDHELIRFDGVRFVPWDPPPNEHLSGRVSSLLAAEDGSLWIRTLATVSRLTGGHLVEYPEADRWLDKRSLSIALDRSGVLWLVRNSKTPELASLSSQGRLRLYGSNDGLTEGNIRRVLDDRHGQLWLLTSSSLCRWTPGQRAECRVTPYAQFLWIAGDRASALLREGMDGVASAAADAFGPLGRAVFASAIQPKCLTRDSYGSFWVGTLGQGLLRANDAQIERYTTDDKLTSDTVYALLEDREHSLWVATSGGLDRFRDPRALRVSTSEGLSSNFVATVAAAYDGGIWAGATPGLNRLDAAGTPVLPAPSGVPRTAFRALAEDKERRLWIGTLDGFGYLSQGRFTEVRGPGQAPIRKVFSISQAPDGVIWLLDEDRGVLVVRGNMAYPADLPGGPLADPSQMFFDASGALWIGHYQQGVSLIQKGVVRLFGPNEGLPSGTVQAIMQDQSGSVWVGTHTGLARYRNGGWTAWRGADGVPEGGILAIVEDDFQNLWFLSSQGVSRIAQSILNQSREGKPVKLAFSFYGQDSGVKPPGGSSNPLVAKSVDGRIWFATANGVTVTDPARIRINDQPPPVFIEEVVVDGAPVDIHAHKLEFLGRHVHLTYAGLSLAAPEGVHYRYQLEGLETRMTDAGTARDADYATLRPARYRFRVSACNADNICNETGAILAFQVLPHFWETLWFKALCLVAIGLAIWGGFQLRLRMLLARYQATVDERARLTRDLHDSLLQGFVAVVYQLEAVARQFALTPEQALQRLQRAIEQADRAVSDARRTMMAMRLPALEKGTLPEALNEVGRQLVDGTHIGFEMAAKGLVTHLPYEEQAAIYLIGREAISNAVNHANPSRIQLLLDYSSRQVQLIVKDNGTGFDLESGRTKSGHWGLGGMHERANQIGAEFSVITSPGNGTTVSVTVPRKGRPTPVPMADTPTRQLSR